jgi:hypothetical protein
LLVEVFKEAKLLKAVTLYVVLSELEVKEQNSGRCQLALPPSLPLYNCLVCVNVFLLNHDLLIGVFILVKNGHSHFCKRINLTFEALYSHVHLLLLDFRILDVFLLLLNIPYHISVSLLEKLDIRQFERKVLLFVSGFKFQNILIFYGFANFVLVLARPVVVVTHLFLQLLILLFLEINIFVSLCHFKT